MSKARSFPRMLCCCFAGFLFCAGVAAADVIVVEGETRAAIQDALNRVGDGGTVIIPPGRYLIEEDATLVIPNDGITLEGSGAAANQTVLYREVDTQNTVMVKSSGRRLVRITGIRFQGVTSPDSAGE